MKQEHEGPLGSLDGGATVQDHPNERFARATAVIRELAVERERGLLIEKVRQICWIDGV